MNIFDMFADDDGTTLVVPATVPPHQTGGPLARRFEAFHQANPHVYDSVVAVAKDLKGRGFSRCSIWLIFNRLRWLYALQTQGDEYKLNNNFTPFYARVVMLAEPDLVDFFEVREMNEPYEPDLKALGVPRIPRGGSTRSTSSGS